MKNFNILSSLFLTISFLLVSCDNSDDPIESAIQSKNSYKDQCTTIQSGQLTASDGSVIEVGNDQWGYNYQARMFNGYYCDAYRDARCCQD